MIRSATIKDLAALCAIYNYYITNTVITFEEAPLAESELWSRISRVSEAGLPWLVAEERGTIVGYAYACAWKERSAYRYCVESTVYLAPDRTGHGTGTRLYETLFAQLRNTPVRAVIGCIAMPNDASVALHEKFGMQKVAHFPRVGYKFSRWVDVAYWHTELGQAA